MVAQSKLKAMLKPAYRRVKNWYVKTFLPFDVAALRMALLRLGLKPGDVLMAHVAYNRFGGFTGGPGDVISTVLEIIGPMGTLLMPTMPFSGSAIDYIAKNKITELEYAPSAMGLVTEIFRRTPGVVRSIHPTHPVAAFGRHAVALIDDHHLARTPCGESSPFLKMRDFDAKILFLGADFRTVTFYHSIEEVLEAKLPASPFTKETYDLQSLAPDGTLLKTTTRLFDPTFSKKRDISKLQSKLRASGALKSIFVKRVPILLVRANDVLNMCQEMADRGEFCYSP